MKKPVIALAATVIAASALTACSGDNEKAADAKGAPAPSGIVPASPSVAAPSQQPVTERSQGSTPQAGAGDAQVTFTKCEPSGAGIVMEAQVKNTTKETRTYIITGLAYDASKKNIGSAAVMVDDVKPGATAKATGKSDKKAKGKLTCEAGNIASLPTG